MEIIKHKGENYIKTTTGYKKIILTTDPKLIADGVQSIDDEFLEWFCSKNGNVDYVDVVIEEDENK
jgi:hypothetical protein